jgi:hypothetical protein
MAETFREKFNPFNSSHIPIPRLQELFNNSIDSTDIWNISRNTAQLDYALNTISPNAKLLHHALIRSYSVMRKHHSDTMFDVIGLDIETDANTGEPKLLGYYFPDGYYYFDKSPGIENLFDMVKSVLANSPRTHFVTWGNLDINCIIRLFDPSEDERKRISSGLGGRYSKGKWLARPPCIRKIAGRQFFIDHYIPGRSLRLGMIRGSWASSIWFYNISQFYETRIAETAKALNMGWIDYGEDSHIVDWQRFEVDRDYKRLVLDSNRQDARIVAEMAKHLGSIFFNVFGGYPDILVSAGSLADAAVSKMLSPEDYMSNSWRYLRGTTFKESPAINLAESLLSEAYSAGYVDQFAIGYFPVTHTADISSAYPHKIRQLPDLRNFKIFAGLGDPNVKIRELESDGWEVFTAAIRGVVTIPEHLRFHPITVKTHNRQNIRPIGTFPAAYMLEERDFCIEWGTRFENEQWTIFATREWKYAPIAKVSERLAILRDDYRNRMKRSENEDETILYDSMQYMVKVVDNSLYGKNVMTTSIVEDRDGKPTVIGLKAGDRYNQLYGAWITAKTRIQIAEACMELQQTGTSEPIMAMTDAVYWTGKKSDLPAASVAKFKTAGFFEPPETVHDFYVVKTGQYEYRKGRKFYHKMRGLNIPYENRVDNESFFRQLISDHAKTVSPRTHPEDFEIPVDIRKLVTIGAANGLEKLGLIEDSKALMRPFVLGSKQVEPFIIDWPDAINGHIWLNPPTIFDSDNGSTMEFLSMIHMYGENSLTRYQRKRMLYFLAVVYAGKYKLPKLLSHMSWQELEDWSGIKREWARL